MQSNFLSKLIIVLLILIQIIYSCRNHDKEVVITNSNSLEAYCENTYNILKPFNTDSIVNYYIEEYADSINSGIIPKDFNNPCFERIVLKEKNILILFGLKSKIIQNVNNIDALKKITLKPNIYDCFCDINLHSWFFPIDSSFHELNLFDIAKTRIEKMGNSPSYRTKKTNN